MGDVDYFLGSQGVEFPGRKSLHVSKIVMDPIQGLIKLDGTFAQIVDTPQFQRLRDLKQLGSAYFIFPGASHNRFEHSLGVAHLSKLWANKFRVDQPGLGVTERQVDLVGLAGLCHDLGHGPFSHVFDNEFIPAVRPHSTWKHEQMSVKLLEHCVDQNHIDLGDDCHCDAPRCSYISFADKEDLQYIGDLIMGDGPSKQRKGRCAFLFDIVNNSRNSVDVDKFDYLQRDAYNVGIKSTCVAQSIAFV
jgi:HD superfamily phosphohydrolase